MEREIVLTSQFILSDSVTAFAELIGDEQRPIDAATIGLSTNLRRRAEDWANQCGEQEWGFNLCMQTHELLRAIIAEAPADGFTFYYATNYGFIWPASSEENRGGGPEVTT